jgi:hypothetical protein
MSETPIIARIEALGTAITTWQRLGPRVAKVVKEVESIRQDLQRCRTEEERAIVLQLPGRRSPTLTASEEGEIRDCTVSLQAFAEHGPAVVAYAHSAGIPAEALAAYTREYDPAYFDKAKGVLHLAFALAQSGATANQKEPLLSNARTDPFRDLQSHDLREAEQERQRWEASHSDRELLATFRDLREFGHGLDREPFCAGMAALLVKLAGQLDALG